MTKICDAYETTRDLPQFCKDRTDCILKQIVSHCRETINVMCSDCGSNPYAVGRDLEARLILQKFDIKECE